MCAVEPLLSWTLGHIGRTCSEDLALRRGCYVNKIMNSCCLSSPCGGLLARSGDIVANLTEWLRARDDQQNRQVSVQLAANSMSRGRSATSGKKMSGDWRSKKIIQIRQLSGCRVHTAPCHGRQPIEHTARSSRDKTSSFSNFYIAQNCRVLKEIKTFHLLHLLSISCELNHSRGFSGRSGPARCCTLSNI
jgi:hypothetical protein